MDQFECDGLSLGQRIEKLENQNRRVRQFCFLAVLVPVLLIIACVSRPGSVVEAQRFVLRDSSGRFALKS